jgi:hypothetical protein
MTANIVLSRVPPGSVRKGFARPASLQWTEMRLSRTAGLTLGFEASAQNQKRGFAAALEQATL